MESISDSLCYNLWGSHDCDWAFLPSEGNSGGILSIWSKVSSSLIFTFVGEGFVGVCLEWGASKTICFVVNIYAKCDLPSKRRLWDNLLMSKRGFGGDKWCVAGDFNSVCSREDRRGVSQEGSVNLTTEMREFGGFIEDMELVDLPLLGRKFTWFHPNGRSMSRIDRDISDHCPLILKRHGYDWGPKPFRFNNHWIEHKNYKKIVKEAWENHSVNGWMGFVLKEKLKGIKNSLKGWNREEFGALEDKIAILIEDINDLDSRSELVGLSNLEIDLRKSKFCNLWKLLKSKEAILFQRSRSKWLREGDANSKYFHSCVNARTKRNAIVALKVGDEWLNSPPMVREAVENFFASHFSAPTSDRPRLDGVTFPSLSAEENLSLTAPFTLEEIETVIKDCDGNKSPGPDGFNFAFVKDSWDLMKGDVRIMFDQFHGNECLPKSFLSYFVTLIPKVESPFRLSDYRPISLLGCLYKLIAKVLANRLAKVMNSIIAPTQSAFLKGRNLVDGVLVINEVVDLAKKTGKECMVFKVDFEKAYDSVDWGFLEYMLQRFGFCDKWIKWIRACVFAGNLSILVNGSPTAEFNIQRGLKQGDPLAPFLFLLVAEGFGGVMKRAVECNLFKGFSIGADGLAISHLQYADDTLCIGEASVQNLWTIKAILRGFHMVSGLKVNFWKSCLMGVNVPSEFLDLACSFLNCRQGVIPFKYLGLPVGANPKRLSTWEPLLDYLNKRLNSWGKKHISFGGRIVLINSVLNSIPIFYMSFLKMPIQVVKLIIQIQRNFLWGGVNGGRKISWISWKTVCQEKKEGGLGVRDVRVVNLSLLAKWRWRLLQNERALWKDVLAVKYGSMVVRSAIFNGVPGLRYASTWWKDICAIENLVDSKKWFSDAAERRVKNGASTLFWSDRWLGEYTLSEAFPRLFSLSIHKETYITDMVVVNGGRNLWNFIWRRRLFTWEEDLVGQLQDRLLDVQLSTEADSWWWKPDPEGFFSVKTTYSLLFKELNDTVSVPGLENHVFQQIWCSPAPSKIIAFSWQLLHNRIPTRDNLLRCGVLRAEDSRGCVFCTGTVESSTHLFLHCDFSYRIWVEIFRWLGVVFVMPSNLFTMFEYLSGIARNKKIRKGYRLVWHSSLWLIWKARNDAIFNNLFKDPTDIAEDIKVLTWKWSAHRLKTTPCLFYEWCWDPGFCFEH
ncbi:LINE-1 reverse transcriptase like [Trifolium medium]|uniref:LINE-1 reverse transcriptase like n=1 Tax=Trifolium medium TaxID=97028 RepID=A0A392LXM5_9FABA|nr:LINE-1 reverse transcriptase like [Trifolium medium]